MNPIRVPPVVPLTIVMATVVVVSVRSPGELWTLAPILGGVAAITRR